MVTIRLPTSPTDQQFEKLLRQWDSATDAEIALPRKMTNSERDALIRFLLSKIPNALAFGALSDLAERPSVPTDLLTRIFDVGDIACKVSVCLRDDLTPELIERCRASSDPNVQEHFRGR